MTAKPHEINFYARKSHHSLLLIPFVTSSPCLALPTIRNHIHIDARTSISFHCLICALPPRIDGIRAGQLATEHTSLLDLKCISSCCCFDCYCISCLPLSLVFFNQPYNLLFITILFNFLIFVTHYFAVFCTA